MTTLFRKTALAIALAATALAGATPAMADSYRGHRGGGDVAGPAIAAGIFGLAIGAIIASSAHDHDRDRYRDGAYNEYNGGYYGSYNGGYNGSYYNRSPYQQQQQQGWYRDREGNRYDQDGRPYGYDRHER